MIYPSADIIEQKVGSRYSLVILAAKRAKQIKEGAPLLIDTLSTNPLTIALEEIAAGKVTIAEGEIVAAPPVSPPASLTAFASEDLTLSDMSAETTDDGDNAEDIEEEPDEEHAAAA